jgi:chromosome segregation ATPase
MQYKTIVLELLQQRTELHEQLRQERKLLETVELMAVDLKANHEAIRDQLQQANPNIAPEQISSEAFEMALKELEDRLSPVSPMDDPAELSLDGAMAFLRNHSQRK